MRYVVELLPVTGDDVVLVSLMPFDIDQSKSFSGNLSANSL